MFPILPMIQATIPVNKRVNPVEGSMPASMDIRKPPNPAKTLAITTEPRITFSGLMPMRLAVVLSSLTADKACPNLVLLKSKENMI